MGQMILESANDNIMFGLSDLGKVPLVSENRQNRFGGWDRVFGSEL